MSYQIPRRLSDVEVRIIKTIRIWRKSPCDVFGREILKHPTHAMYHVISLCHGNVKFRFQVVAKELGVEMRTLERAFKEEFGYSMFEMLIKVRLEYAQALLRMSPRHKISYVASMLGYNNVSEFHHFFESQTNETPAAWSRREGGKLEPRNPDFRVNE